MPWIQNVFSVYLYVINPFIFLLLFHGKAHDQNTNSCSSLGRRRPPAGSSQTTNNETTEPKSTNVCGHLLGSNDQKVKWEVLRQKAKLKENQGHRSIRQIKAKFKGALML